MSEAEEAVWTAVYAAVMSQSDWGSTAEQQARALQIANRAVLDFKKARL